MCFSRGLFFPGNWYKVTKLETRNSTGPWGEKDFIMSRTPRNTLLEIFLAPLAYFLVRSYLLLVRIRVLNEDTVLQYLQTGRKAIGAIWHQRFFGVIGYARKFSKFSPSAMISMSRDGEWIAQVALRLGIRPVRGSSTRGGKEALAAMVRDLAQNQVAIHGVDGPQGPKGEVKAGLIRMAQLSGAAIIPIYISVDRAWITRSWDRFLIPKPFSRILVRFGEPVFVPENMESETFEATRLDVEKKMIQGHAQDDLNWGWERPL
jgi:lysophospholipid acyltransferase (LPLAT)-like uncharacterized protein